MSLLLPLRTRVLQFDDAEVPGIRLEVLGTQYTRTIKIKFKKVKVISIFRKKKTVKMRMKMATQKKKL